MLLTSSSTWKQQIKEIPLQAYGYGHKQYNVVSAMQLHKLVI